MIEYTRFLEEDRKNFLQENVTVVHFRH
jgi:hypothetical protein